MRKIVFAAVCTLFAAFTGVAQAQPVVRDGVLTGVGGRTVYTFDKDQPGKSNCSGGCLTVWQPFIAKPEAVAKGEFGLIDAGGGNRQWTVNGKPLYYNVGDTQPGDRRGDGQGGVWHVVKP